MHLPVIHFLVAVAVVIALPVSKTDLDHQAGVEGKLEVREPKVRSWFEVVSFRLLVKKLL